MKYSIISKYRGVVDSIPGQGGWWSSFILDDRFANLKVCDPIELNRILKDRKLRLESYTEVTEFDVCKDRMYVVEYNSLDCYCQGDMNDIFIGTLGEVKDFIDIALKGLLIKGLSSDLTLPIISITDSIIHICVKPYRKTKVLSEDEVIGLLIKE